MATKKKVARVLKSVKLPSKKNKKRPASKQTQPAKPPLGSVIWMGLSTDNDRAAAAFYENVLNLKSAEVSMGAEHMVMLSTSEGQLAHIAPVEPGAKPRWITFFYSDDIDATAKAVLMNGGKIVMEPNDIPPGRVAFFLDSSGAEFAVFKPK
jgi:uncharacterized protein